MRSQMISYSIQPPQNQYQYNTNYNNSKQWAIFFIILVAAILMIIFLGALGLFLGILLIIYDFLGIKIIYSYENGVLFTLGYYSGVLKGGLLWVAPGFQRLIKISLRQMNIDLTRLSLVTKDNVPVNINGTVFYRVIDPASVILKLENYQTQLFNYSQTVFRDIVGKFELNDLLQNRDAVASEIYNIIEREISGWGIQITAVKIQDISIPQQVQEALLQQAASVRQQKAMITISEGEKQAAINYVEAAKILSSDPLAFNLRVLQALRDMQTDKVIIIPSSIFEWFNR